MALVDIPSYIPDVNWIQCESRPTPCSCVFEAKKQVKKLKPGTRGIRNDLDQLRKIIDGLERLCPTYVYQRAQKGPCNLPCNKLLFKIDNRLGR